MKVVAIRNNSNLNQYITKPVFLGKNESNKTNNTEKKKVYGIVAAAALSATVIGGAIAGHKISKSLQYLRTKTAIAEQTNAILRTNLGNATKENEKLQKELKLAKEKANNSTERFLNLFEDDINPEEARTALLNKLQKEVKETELNYDYMKVPEIEKAQKAEKELIEVIPLPENVSTTNRIYNKIVEAPEFKFGEDLHFELPMSDEVTITKESKDFKPIMQKATEVSADYADDITWNSDKIARDIIQNFYDGHGQTLDGIKMSFIKGANDKYKVKIEGQSTYSPSKAIFIGKSSKRDNAKAAGHYGEGLKISVLKLLKNYGTEDVKIASDNWQTTWKFMNSEVENEKVLSYSLEKVNHLDGNYIEFETKDEGLLQSLCQSVNRFYHSGNKDFQCPNFENNLMGIKILKPNEKGGIYIAGQKFEVDNDYEGLKGLSIFIKEKPPEKIQTVFGEKTIFDQSRDRISLNAENLGLLGEWLAREPRMSKEDLSKIISSMRRYWDKLAQKDNINETNFINKIIRFAGYFPKELRMKFPEKYIAYSPASTELLNDITQNGYVVCNETFTQLGMPTIKDVIGNSRDHKALELNDIEKKKIIIIKKALEQLGVTLKDKHFTPEEIDAKVYMFDKNAKNESDLSNNTLAEAIIDNNKSKGFWIDKNYLDKDSFANVLGTALHELSHKAGGDESSDFSYKLTDVLKDVINQFTMSPETRNYMYSLQNIWNNLGNVA